MTKRKNESKEEYNERTTLCLYGEYEEGAQLQVQIRTSRKGKILPAVLNLRTQILPAVLNLRTQIECLAHAHKCRGLGFNPISQEHEGCEWHHVNEKDVVQVPIHRVFGLKPKMNTEGVLG